MSRTCVVRYSALSCGGLTSFPNLYRFIFSFFCFENELLRVAIMVFESYVVDLLNKFAGQYLENLDSSQLRIGIWGGGSIVARVARAFVWIAF